jgi:hypothetical protein
MSKIFCTDDSVFCVAGNGELKMQPSEQPVYTFWKFNIQSFEQVKPVIILEENVSSQDFRVHLPVFMVTRMNLVILCARDMTCHSTVRFYDLNTFKLVDSKKFTSEVTAISENKDRLFFASYYKGESWILEYIDGDMVPLVRLETRNRPISHLIVLKEKFLVFNEMHLIVLEAKSMTITSVLDLKRYWKLHKETNVDDPGVLSTFRTVTQNVDFILVFGKSSPQMVAWLSLGSDPLMVNRNRLIDCQFVFE